MIVSGPTTIVKGSTNSFTLNVSELIPLITSDYFKEPGFWRNVYVCYRHNGSTQHQTIDFDYEDQSTCNEVKTGELTLSVTAQEGEWNLISITIFDRDRGKILISPLEIPNIETYNLTVTAS